MILASTRTQIADFLSALIYVYTLLIIVYVVVQLLFSAGLRPPYSRTVDAVLGFLRDVCEPFLRHLPARASVVRRHRLQPHHRDHHALDPQQRRGGTHHPRLSAVAGVPDRPAVAWLRAALVAAVVVVVDQLSKRAVEHSITPGEERGVFPGVELVNTRNHGVAFGFLPGSHVVVTMLIGVALALLLVYFARHTGTPWIWLPTGMLLGGAIGNILDRVRHDSVTDLVKLPLGWPPFNLADASITLGILLLFVAVDTSRRKERERGRRPRLHDRLRGRPPARRRQGPGRRRASRARSPRGHARAAARAAADEHRRRRRDPERPGIVHRLDRDTSGLLVVARNEEVHRRLQRALAQRRIEREYIALVEGMPPARTGTIEAPIGRDPRVRTRMAVGGAGARNARTHFTLERTLPRTSLLRLRLETGRTHQIRVHLQAIGHPVCGDPEYGTAGMLGLERQFLHAARLAFEHPVSGERVDVSSPLPADLRRALAAAERLS